VSTAPTGTHAGLRKFRPHFRAMFAASGTDEVRFDVRQPDMIGPAVGAHRDVVAACAIVGLTGSIPSNYNDCDHNECRDQRKNPIKCLRAGLCGGRVERRHDKNFLVLTSFRSLSAGVRGTLRVAALPADSIGFHRVGVYLRLVDKPALGAP
jgi:hypothetical protein